jgi:hypothetical protein
VKQFLVMVLMFPVFPLTAGGSVTKTIFIPADDPGIRYIGRWDRSDPLHPRQSWPGTAIAAEFTGTAIGIRMTDNDNYYNITIDGRLVGVLHGDKPGEAEYPLAGGLAGGRHSLVLSKRNISFNPPPSFSGFLVEGKGLVAPEPSKPALKIEFIGDSFTAAEGNEATEASMPWEAKKPVTDIDKGFAKIVAAHFSAEVNATCRSGIGMVCDWRGDRTISMPKFFDRTLMESPEPKWDFRRWMPDLAVVCLGLNDHSGLHSPDGSVSDENSDLFRKSYRVFLDTLRTKYPGVRILAVAAAPEWIRRNVRQVVDEETAAGKSDVFYGQFDDFPGGAVADGHPNLESHRKIAAQIIEAVEAIPGFRNRQ